MDDTERGDDATRRLLGYWKSGTVLFQARDEDTNRQCILVHGDESFTPFAAWAWKYLCRRGLLVRLTEIPVMPESVTICMPHWQELAIESAWRMA